MVSHNLTARYLRSQNGTANDLLTRWIHKGTGASPPDQRSQSTAELMQPRPQTPPSPPHHNADLHPFQIDTLRAGYVYSDTSHSSSKNFTPDADAQDSQHNPDFDPDILTDVVPSTSYYTRCWVVIQLTPILKMRAACWANLQVMRSIECKEWNFGDYYYLQLVDTVKFILNDIFICIVKEQCSDQQESLWKC